MATYVFIDLKTSLLLSFACPMRFLSQIFTSLFVLLSPSLFALSLEGRAKIESLSYFSKTDNYSLFRLIAEPQIHIIDGLIISARLDVDNGQSSQRFFSSGLNPQSYSLLFYNNKKEVYKNLPQILLPYVFVEYQNELFQVQIGKMPYHFGIGLSYFDDEVLFSNWASYTTGISFYFQHANYYLQPRVFINQNEKEFVGLVEAGLEFEDWDIEGFYKYDFSTQISQTEFFARLLKDNWDLKLSGSYVFQDDLSLALAAEWDRDIHFGFISKALLKAGYVSSQFSLHPNYNLSLISWNFKPNAKAKEVSIEPGRLQDVAYFHSGLEFSFFNKYLLIEPSVLGAFNLGDQDWLYEVNLALGYYFNPLSNVGVVLGLQGEKGSLQYGFLAKAAAGF